MKYRFDRKIIIHLLICFILFTGCSSNKLESQEKNSKPKPPVELREIEVGLLEFITTLETNMLEKIKQKQDKAQNQTQEATQQGGQGAENNQGQGQNQQKKEQENQNQNEQGQKQQQGMKQWEKHDKTLNRFHDLWNDALPLVKEQVELPLIDAFSSTLNELTIKANSRQLYDTLFSANELYGQIPGLLKNYSSESPLGIKEMRYLTKKVIITAMAEDWYNSLNSCHNLIGLWNTLKPSLTKPKVESKEKMGLSIDELKKALDQKDVMLVKIKGDIVLKNIDKIEESYKKSQQN